MTITVAEALTKHQNGTLVPNDIFYDWFCSNKALVGRTKTLATKLKMLAKSSLIHPETDTVFFKNNCPVDGKLYDSLSICRDGEVVYWICPSSGHTSKAGISEVFDGINNREFEGTWTDVKEFFKSESKE